MKNKFFISISIILIFMITSTFGTAFASANPTAESYLIVFKDTVNPGVEVPAFAKAYGLQPGFIYEHALKGMSAMIPEGRLTALQHDPRVAYVEKDMEHHIEVQTIPTGIQRIFADDNTTIDIDGSDDYRVDVDVAVIDTGIDVRHPDLRKTAVLQYVQESGKHSRHIMPVIVFKVMRTIDCIKLAGIQSCQLPCIANKIRLAARINIE